MNKKGFTLIELLAVIAILAILVIIALPNVLKLYNDARKNSFLTEAKTIYNEVTNKYISESMKNNKLSYISSEDDTKLNMSGESLQYCILLNNDGTVSEMKVSNGSYIVTLDKGKKVTDLTTSDVIEGNLDGYKCNGNTVLPAKTFSEDTWEVIASNAKNCVNNPSSCAYKVGDTKTIELGTYGTHTLRIANLSTPEECNQEDFSQSACGFVIEFADIITTHVMNSTSTNKGGWPASEMYNFLNDESDTSSIINSLPTDLKTVIINTKTVSGHGSSDTENFTSTDKLYLLSTHEVWEKSGTTTLSTYDTAYDQTRQLDYYKNKGVTTNNYSEAIKKNNGTSGYWWLRAANSNYSNIFYSVSSSGDWNGNGALNISCVSPAFRIG